MWFALGGAENWCNLDAKKETNQQIHRKSHIGVPPPAPRQLCFSEQCSLALSFPARCAGPPPSSWLWCFQRESPTLQVSPQLAALSNLTNHNNRDAAVNETSVAKAHFDLDNHSLQSPTKSWAREAGMIRCSWPRLTSLSKRY